MALYFIVFVFFQLSIAFENAESRRCSSFVSEPKEDKKRRHSHSPFSHNDTAKTKKSTSIIKEEDYIAENETPTIKNQQNKHRVRLIDLKTY